MGKRNTMKKIIFIILLMLPFPEIQPQVNASAEPILDGTDVEFVNYIKEPPGAMTNGPDKLIFRVSGYMFAIRFRITFDNIETLDSLYSVVCYMPDFSVQKLKIIPDSLHYISDNSAGYSFILNTGKEGWVDIILVSNDEIQSGQNEHFYTRKSNEQSVYLKIPR